jgi:anti-sigma regulatory factor (Ser/Thr protein kinase)
MSTGFDVVLSGGVDSASAARRAIAANDPTLPASVRDDVSLLVTELVTNAVRHGGVGRDTPLGLEFRHEAGRVRVEVVDSGTEFESPSRPTDGDSSGGWGLLLVDRIAERWGVCRTSAGKCVWFELPVGASRAGLGQVSHRVQ